MIWKASRAGRRKRTEDALKKKERAVKEAQLSGAQQRELLPDTGVVSTNEAPQSLMTSGTPPLRAADALKSKLASALGCKTPETALVLLDQVSSLDHATTEVDPAMATSLRLTAMAQLAELHPATAGEAMLAAQMVGTQRLAMSFMNRATAPGQSDEVIDRNVARATRLMQLFCVQTETLAKMKGKGVQQRVVVEHVTVAAGGNAFVGAFSTRGRASSDAKR